MILRAIFWVAVVAILMPHEPDLGFGRPSDGGSGVLTQMSDALKSPHACEGNEGACFAAFTLMDKVKAEGFHRLAQVKADIEEAQRERRESRPRNFPRT